MATAAGHILKASELDNLGGQVLDACNVTTSPIITAATFSSATDIPRLRLNAPVVAGQLYVFAGQQLYNINNTDTELNINIKLGSTGGTTIGTIRLSRPWIINFGFLSTWWIPWSCVSTNAAQAFFFVVQRASGTGTTTLEGGTTCFNSIITGNPSNSVMRVVT